MVTGDFIVIQKIYIYLTQLHQPLTTLLDLNLIISLAIVNQ